VETGAVYVAVVLPVDVIELGGSQVTVMFSPASVIFAIKEEVAEPFASNTLGFGGSTVIDSEIRSTETV
jgi:hypothetical protein